MQQLGLFVDAQEVLRCRGRLHYADLHYDTKFPILLPKNSTFTSLVIQHTHTMLKHGGVQDTLTQIRQQFWIPQGRQLVKRLISKCVISRKHEGPHLHSVPTPPLPKEQISQSQPFQHTGIDFAGPMYVRNKNTTSNKVYVCLFTCTAIRATHLELVEDQTTEAFLRAFRRFIGRRGVPETIISDNAKTFKAAAQDLETLHSGILSHTSTQKFLANNGIRWKFIAERAPWWGGFFRKTDRNDQKMPEENNR
ncbi:uncharacterized protein [Montipora capricornis]|uniref:uncharacterized protein n=1 Tax=Montipora capricornis TaxID=246305 RepID=UPI0035F11BB9